MIIADVQVHASRATAKMRPYPNDARTPKKSCSKTEDRTAMEHSLLPVGACGLKVQFCFLDPRWEPLSKTAVFRNGNMTMDAIIVDDCATIPHELLTKVTDTVYVGIYGTDSGSNIAIPTIWAPLGTVSGAACPSRRTSSPVTQPYWTQVKEQVDAFRKEMMVQEDLEEALIQAKESGAFDGPQGPKGVKGDRGEPGYSPVKGVDYWTEADRQAVVSEAVDEASEKLQDLLVLTNEKAGDLVSLNDSQDKKFQGLTLYGKTTQNGTPTPAAPVEPTSVGDNGFLNVTVCGKNILPNNLETQTLNGITFTVGKDGSITANGTTNAYTDVYLYGQFSDNGNYLFVPKGNKFVANTIPDQIFFILREKTVGAIYDVDAINRITREKDCYFYGICLRVPPHATVNNFVTYPMICQASNIDTYEPFKGAQTLTVSTPNGLSGIPVSSGGNYTDSYGYQWLCDEIDFARGKHVQRVGVIESYDHESITGQYMSSTGALTAGAKVLYSLDSPVETDLTAEALSAYSALHANCPNTTIYSDDGAGIRVKYSTDTKLYIGGKIEELASAILNTV